MELNGKDTVVTGGYNTYGFDIGVLMLDSTFPRIPGDIGNAQTFKYPVLYKKVVGGTPKKVVLELTSDDIAPFIEAAKELEAEGVKAITTSCGFLALFQDELANSVNIPVYTSSLLLVPMVKKIIGRNQKVGVLTANSNTLSNKHLEAAGIDKECCVIKGLEEKPNFTHFTVQNWNSVDVSLCRAELISATQELLNENKDVGAIVLECTNMPPYTKDIQQIAKLPVFDIVSLTNMIHYSLNGTDF